MRNPIDRASVGAGLRIDIRIRYAFCPTRATLRALVIIAAAASRGPLARSPGAGVLLPVTGKVGDNDAVVRGQRR